MQFLDQEKFQLDILGDGALRNSLEKYACELKINSIKFMEKSIMHGLK